MQQPAEDRQLVWQRCGELSIEAQNVARTIEWVGDDAADHLADRVQLVFKRRSDAKVAAAAAQAPEQIGVLALARGQHFACGRHHLDRAKVIDGHAVLAHQPAQAAS